MRMIASVLAAGMVAFAASGAFAAGKGFNEAAIGAVGLPGGGGVLATSGAGIGNANQASPPSGGYSPLSAAECEGLGGKVLFSLACAAGGRSACVTVDSNGVVRKVCLTK